MGHSVHDTLLLITNFIMDKDACISITMGSYTTIKGTSIMETLKIFDTYSLNSMQIKRLERHDSDFIWF